MAKESMKDRLVQVIKEKHILTWDDDGNTGVAAGEYKLVFQHGDEIVCISELNEGWICESTVDEYMEEYDKGDCYRPHDSFISADEYYRFMDGMEKIYTNGVHGTFRDVVTALADGGAVVHKDVRLELEIIHNAIGRILERQ